MVTGLEILVISTQFSVALVTMQVVAILDSGGGEGGGWGGHESFLSRG